MTETREAGNEAVRKIHRKMMKIETWVLSEGLERKQYI